MISVVMGVYNGGQHLAPTVESIQKQEGLDFEFIIVDDGSTDDSWSVIHSLSSRDQRIRVIKQKNMGLTKALINGCKESKGEYIARQDVGDFSRSDRLSRQADFLGKNSKISLISSWTRYIGPESEELFNVSQPYGSDVATNLLRSTDPRRIRSISHHGTAMFRKSDYDKVKGYREQFYYAQDLDLWKRLVEIGNLHIIPEFLYTARWDEGSISAVANAKQRKLKRIIAQLANFRRIGKDESPLLRKAQKIRPQTNKRRKRLRSGAGYYFIGKMLQGRDDPRAQKYFRRTIQTNPFHMKARIAVLRYKSAH